MKTRGLFPDRWMNFALCVMLIMGLGACTGGELPFPSITSSSKNKDQITFEIIAQGYPTTENSATPAVLVAMNAEKALDIFKWIDDEQVKQQIGAIDFNKSFLLAVFRGMSGNSAAGIEIMSIEPVSAQQIRVVVELTEPGEGQTGASVIGYPYQIVSILRSDVTLAEPATWSMIDTKGAPLAEFRSETARPPTEGTGTLPFVTLGQGYSLTAELSSPQLFVASDAAATSEYSVWFQDQALIQSIQEVNYANSWVIAVFRGRVGSSTYGIQVKSIQMEGDNVRVVVEFLEPAPDQQGASVIAYPYHIVSLSRDLLPASNDSTWTLYDIEGKMLYEVKP